MEAMRQQVEVAKNTAAQQYQALHGARARITLAQKTLADTVVRAPFSGVVAQRMVSVGDYVTKGMKVAVVVRVNPLRVELTDPEQFVSAMSAGQPVSFEVDAYPDRTFEGKVRYVSPPLETSQRAPTVEAIVPNPGGVLKPGLFASARIEQPARTPVSSCRRARCKRPPARAASSWSTAIRSKSAWSPSDRPSINSSRSPAA